MIRNANGIADMRYYFHLRVGPTLSPDEIGLDLPDLETAYLEAFKAAQEMWPELLTERCDPLIRSFEIADERGQILLTLPCREVLERARKPSAPLSKLRQSLQSNLLRGASRLSWFSHTAVSRF
jgi:hypothetical protein